MLILFLLTEDRVKHSLVIVIVSILILEMQLDLPLASKSSLTFTWQAVTDHGMLQKSQDGIPV